MSEESKALAPVESEASVMLSGIMRAVKDPEVSVDKLERMFALAERMQTDQRRTAFMAALARLQDVLPQIAKSGVILGKDGSARSRFAKIEDIDNQIRPLCSAEGFSFSFDSRTLMNANGVAVSIEYVGTLHHREGHSETKTLNLPVDNHPSRNAVQSIGSTTSYARRYLLGMHLNLVTRDEDDDGSNGGNEPITAAQVTELRKGLEEAGGDPARFLKWLGVEKVEDVRLCQFGRATKFIDEKKRQKGVTK